MNLSKINNVLTTVRVEEMMEVLQELLGFHWTWTVLLLLILSEAQQHVDLKSIDDINIIDNILRNASYIVPS